MSRESTNVTPDAEHEQVEIAEALLDTLSAVPDPRSKRGTRHSLSSMLWMALVSVLCGADDWAQVVTFCENQKAWLSGLMRLPHGIPCISTFEHVFALIEPKAFGACLVNMSKQLVRNKQADRQIAIDGKRLRRSFKNAQKQGALHLLHAFGVQSGVLLGQEATDCKENEITAMPRLLNMLDIRDKTVTGDAMLTQKAIASQIVKQGGDYVLALKDNHKNLHQDVKGHFEFAERREFTTTRIGTCFGYHTSAFEVEKEHGRIEARKVEVLCAKGRWLHATHSGWESVNSVIRITRERTVGEQVTSHEVHYYLSSHEASSCKKLAQFIRNHWSVENRLHWSLDESFNEDRSRLRKGHGAQNFASLRRLVLGRLRQDKRSKLSIKNKRFKAALDLDYRLKMLTF